MTYACAAVSDFYVDKPVEHKIQSGDKLELTLQATPKKLGKIKEWNPSTFLVSFKLETDLKLLEAKAKGSMQKYGADAVIANEMKSRRTAVTIYSAKKDKKEDIQLLAPDYDDQISEMIVDHILYNLMNLDRFVPEVKEKPEKRVVREERLDQPKKTRKPRRDFDAESNGSKKGYDRRRELFVENIVPVKDNMSFSREEDAQLLDLFSRHGEVIKLKFIKATFEYPTVKAYIEFATEESANTAAKKLNGSNFRNETLTVSTQEQHLAEKRRERKESGGIGKYKPRFADKEIYEPKPYIRKEGRGGRGGRGGYGYQEAPPRKVYAEKGKSNQYDDNYGDYGDYYDEEGCEDDYYKPRGPPSHSKP